MNKLPFLVFDVNETLFDLEALTPHFKRLFGDESAMREWFAQLILHSEALTLAKGYVSFGELAGAVLKMVAEVRGSHVSEADVIEVKKAIAAMPPHPDVRSGLGKLRDAGFTLYTLTNNPKAFCVEQLERGGLNGFFEQTFSIDDGAKRYKPAPEAYRAVELALNASPDQLCLVACHTWDTLGAAAMGWHSALLKRPGNAPLAIGEQPVAIAGDLDQLADQLIARFCR
ncbi:haloacid dehalogenase type II [Niveibacterium terrae]|uniref:haloacid dehalogenase type II n=1 Tax=Niveibacterium terrae TaxID=3373598 RepID=UPI003A92C941